MSLDLLPALRDSVIGEPDIIAELDEFRGEPAVLTRRPVPAELQGKRFCIINPPAAISDADGLTSPRPIWMSDIAFYGAKNTEDMRQDHTREIDRAAYAARELFHRQKFSVRPEGYSVIDVVAAGPVPAPVDDDMTVGRLVSLTIRLRRSS